MSKPFTLTKEEFITRSMAGEVFIDSYNHKHYYDDTETNPFRRSNQALRDNWDSFTDGTLFTLEEPKPVFEDRWQIRKDQEGYTLSTSNYYNLYYIDKDYKESDGYYKGPKIAVEVPRG